MLDCRITTAWLTFMLLALAWASLAAHAALGQDPDPALKAPGKLIEVGGHRLHINCTGRGSPTVVMEAGAGDFSFDWDLVRPGVKRFTRMCTYDRAGYAWSQPGPTPRTLGQIAYELHELLQNAGIREPVILVGHSLGGLIVRKFAALYPDKVAGMVLVDSAHEDQLVGTIDQTTKQGKIVRWRELSRGRPVPANQTTSSQTSSSQRSPNSSGQAKIGATFGKLPLPSQKMRLWAVMQPNYIPARISEFDFIAEEIADMHSGRAIHDKSLGDKPLMVLTHGVDEYPGTDEDKAKLTESHRRLQADLLRLSRDSKQVIATTSRHHIQVDAPEVVVEGIRRVVDAVRHHKKLTLTR